MKITVLMSTYNGEKFLREQIDSILAQKYVNTFLSIRDDGSKDGTLNILQEYEKNENIKISYGLQSGVGRSFMNLLFDDESDSDYYAFSDQDDIWDDNKLFCAIKAIEESGDGAWLYVCNQRCIDGSGRYIGNRFASDFPVQRLHNSLFVNLYAGCTMVFNRQLKDKICDKKRRPDISFFDHRIHDSWVACVASLYNPIIYDYECHMSFRRHGNNETDAEIIRNAKGNKKIELILFCRKLKRLFRKNKRHHSIELTALSLLNGYGDVLDYENEHMLTIVSDYRKSINNKIVLLFSDYFRKGAPEKKIDLFIKTILNIL